MKHQSSSLVMAVLVTVGLVLLAVYPSTVTGYPRTRYSCRWNTNDDGRTFERIDCISNRDAKSLKGCQKRCTANSECVGIEWIPRRKGWLEGRICCFLKEETADTEPAENLVFCSKLY
ncbi:hypothetical protein CBR_g21271 [Chara braunii]|uniref:Apple domain-containing protein n=1 Tax=Chara braunii TaxID=69332 RepID=A0A388L168_CHABU|nr:hypothetical protein CBR_g21271 [Chara braunii]|eukprot:GBG76031.1 hypothetical protein CBR_g21271 [Chara braunii]